MTEFPSGPYYCHICNARMDHNVYVCDSHQGDASTHAAFRYVLRHALWDHIRTTPDAPAMDLSVFGIHPDVDLRMDEGL